MEGLKGLFKSKKFLGALIGTVVVALQGYFFKDHPQFLEMLVAVCGLFGIQIAGQAHADANDDAYSSNKAEKK